MCSAQRDGAHQGSYIGPFHPCACFARIHHRFVTDFFTVVAATNFCRVAFVSLKVFYHFRPHYFLPDFTDPD